MRILVAVLVVAACGSKNPAKPDARDVDAPRPIDAAIDAAIDAKVFLDAPAFLDAANNACNVLTQTGCPAGDKCTWIEDATIPQPLGHIGCAPDGTVALAGACTYGPPGATGYDNCTKGDVCQGGKCKLICDSNGGTPMCPATAACSIYSGLFGPVGQPVAAGVCDPTCNPLDDNDFLGSGSKPGSACAGSNQGCYGYPSTSSPSKYACVTEVNKTLVHRSVCQSNNGCANGSPYLNGCAQGYIPLLYDMFGSMQIDCIAMCKPINCYQGNCGTNSVNLPGASPHTCTPTDARGAFNLASGGVGGNNGEQCMYSWLFELNTMGHLVRSPTSDTLGFCVDHSKYKWDSNGDGMIDAADAAWVKCDLLASPGFGSGSGSAGAADFGCVDSITGGAMFSGKQPIHVPPMRLPYAVSVE